MEKFYKILDLISSRRIWIALLTAVIPVISKEVFNTELTMEQVIQLTTLGVTLIGALTVRDHNPEPVVEPPKV